MIGRWSPCQPCCDCVIKVRGNVWNVVRNAPQAGALALLEINTGSGWASASISQSDGTPLTATTDASGDWSVTMFIPGHYRVRFVNCLLPDSPQEFTVACGDDLGLGTHDVYSVEATTLKLDIQYLSWSQTGGPSVVKPASFQIQRVSPSDYIWTSNGSYAVWSDGVSSLKSACGLGPPTGFPQGWNTANQFTDQSHCTGTDWKPTDYWCPNAGENVACFPLDIHSFAFQCDSYSGSVAWPGFGLIHYMPNPCQSYAADSFRPDDPFDTRPYSLTKQPFRLECDLSGPLLPYVGHLCREYFYTVDVDGTPYTYYDGPFSNLWSFALYE